MIHKCQTNNNTVWSKNKMVDHNILKASDLEKSFVFYLALYR